MRLDPDLVAALWGVYTDKVLYQVNRLKGMKCYCFNFCYLKKRRYNPRVPRRAAELGKEQLSN